MLSNIVHKQTNSFDWTKFYHVIHLKTPSLPTGTGTLERHVIGFRALIRVQNGSRRFSEKDNMIKFKKQEVTLSNT